MIKNVLANYAGKVWTILSSFLFIPLYIKYLGIENYSIISFSLVISGVMVIVDAGMTATLTREFASGSNSQEKKKDIFFTLETLYFIIMGVSIVILFLLADMIAHRWLQLNDLTPSSVSK